MYVLGKPKYASCIPYLSCANLPKIITIPLKDRTGTLCSLSCFSPGCQESCLGQVLRACTRQNSSFVFSLGIREFPNTILATLSGSNPCFWSWEEHFPWTFSLLLSRTSQKVRPFISPQVPAAAPAPATTADGTATARRAPVGWCRADNLAVLSFGSGQ